MPGRRKISTDATTGAPSGENTSLAGTELVPISGSQVTLISTIASYIRTLVQTLTGKTINLTDNTLTGTTAQFNTALSDGNFAVNVFKTIAVSGQSDVVADSDTDTLTLAAGSNITITTNATTDTVTVAASGGNSFGTIAVSGQSDVVADAAPDTLTLAAGSNVTITTNAGSDTVTIAASGGNAFGTVAVSGQSDVVADAAPDTLTLAAGGGIVLTTNAGSDTVTIANTGGSFVLNTNTTPVANVGAGEDDLITYAVAGNTLDTNAQYIHYIMGGTFASSINSKRIRVKLGSTTLFDTGALAITAAGDWHVEGYIIRTGSATQRCVVEFASNEAAMLATADYVDATEDLTTSLTLKATGEATDNDDIIQKLLVVEKGGGSGGVSGPSSSTDNAIVRFDGTTGKLVQDSAITVGDTGIITFPDNIRQTFNPGADAAGLNVGSIAGDPGTPSNGDLWYDSTANTLDARINGATVNIGTSEVVQVVNTQTGASSTTTTIVPLDDTIPQNTEGGEFMTLAVTPTNASNILYIDVTIFCVHSTASWMIAALFQDTTANALAAMPAYNTTSAGGVPITFRHKMTAGTTSATTFKVRAGGGGAGTTTFNGSGGARLFGGVLASSITITEVLA